MQVGNTAKLKYCEEREEVFTASSPSIIITRPDGSIEPSPPTVTVVETEPGDIQTLVCNYEPVIGGSYTLEWHFDDGSGDQKRTVPSFAFWTDVPGFIRTKLSLSPRKLPSATIEQEFARIARGVIESYPCMISYSALTGDDREYFDESVAFTASATLYSSRSGAASGDVTSIKAGTFEFKYGSSNADAPTGFIDEAANSLGKISCVKAARVGDNFSFNRVTGPTRQAKQYCVPRSYLNILIDIAQDPTKGLVPGYMKEGNHMAFKPDGANIIPATSTVSATTTLTMPSGATTYEVSTASAPVQITLPAANGSNVPLIIDWVTGPLSNALTIVAAGSDTFDVALPALIVGSSITLRSYASGKWVIN